MNDAAVIINRESGSGHGSEWADTLATKFRAQGVQAEITLADNGDEIARAVRDAIAAGVQTVVAGGGDGTINEVASLLVGTKLTLGVLPLGTLNHFAKDLGVPLDLDQAIENVATGHAILVDTGEVNGKVFLNNSSLGLYPDMVREREKQQRRLGRGKWPAFFWASMMALRRWPFLNVRLNVDGKQLTRRSAFVFIGNNEYSMDGFNIGSRGRLDAGQLSLGVSHRTGRLGLLVLAFRALLGRIRQATDLDVVSAREILIETRHRQMRVAIDGEVGMMSMPLNYRIRPASLRVIVPLAADKDIIAPAG